MFYWVLNTSPIMVSRNVCLFCYFVHFESIKFRSSRSQMSFKIKNFAIFRGKHLCWSLFVIKFPACKPANLLKRGSNTSIFSINIAKYLRTAFFIEHFQWLLFKAMFETCQNLKNKKGFY